MNAQTPADFCWWLCGVLAAHPAPGHPDGSYLPPGVIDHVRAQLAQVLAGTKLEQQAKPPPPTLLYPPGVRGSSYLHDFHMKQQQALARLTECRGPGLGSEFGNIPAPDAMPAEEREKLDALMAERGYHPNRDEQA